MTMSRPKAKAKMSSCKKTACAHRHERDTPSSAFASPTVIDDRQRCIMIHSIDRQSTWAPPPGFANRRDYMLIYICSCILFRVGTYTWYPSFPFSRDQERSIYSIKTQVTHTSQSFVSSACRINQNKHACMLYISIYFYS